MRRCLGLCLAVLLSGCATAPPIVKARLDGVLDPADALKRYYEERLTPSEDGYRHRGQAYNAYHLPAFFDAQGATTSAAWARQGRNFRDVGWTAGALLVAVGAGISVQADSNSLERNAWWLSLLPAVYIGWTFHWIGDGWFTKPSVALYNKELANRLGMSVAPKREDTW